MNQTINNNLRISWIRICRVKSHYFCQQAKERLLEVIMGRIFVTGDTHGSHDIRKLNSKKFPRQNMLTTDDYVIICGDFGLVWDESDEEKYWQKWLDAKNFTRGTLTSRESLP